MSSKPSPKLTAPDPLQPDLVAVNYRRVSFVGDRGQAGGGEFFSPDLQAAPFRDFCRSRGWEPDEELSTACQDLDESAFRKHWSKRPGIMRLLEAARAGKFQVLVVLTVSRLARRMSDFLEIASAFREAGVSIYFTREGLDTGHSYSRSMLNILANFAEMEAESTSEWQKGVAARKRSQGQHYGPPPFWLRRSATGEGYEFHEEKAATARRLFELRREMRSYIEIARILNAEGHTSRRGLVWTTAQCARYLGQEKYYLAALGISTATGSGGEKVLLPGAFPPLQTEQEISSLRLIQSRLQESLEASGMLPARRSAKPGRRADTPYLISGLGYCAFCGRKLSSRVGGSSENSRRVYRCMHAQCDPSSHPEKVYVTSGQIEEAVGRVVQIALEPAYAPPRKEQPTRRARKQKKASDTLETLQQIEEEMGRIGSLYAKGRMLESVYNDLHAPLLEKWKKLVSHEAEAQGEAARIEATVILAEETEAPERAYRSAFLLTIERIEFPVVIPEAPTRRGARVYLNPGISDFLIWDVPLYTKRFAGERVCFPREAPKEKGVDSQ